MPNWCVVWKITYNWFSGRLFEKKNSYSVLSWCVCFKCLVLDKSVNDLGIYWLILSENSCGKMKRSLMFTHWLNLLYAIVCYINMNWTKKLSLFGGNWKSLIFKISIGMNDYTHKNSKNQVDLIFQLFVYILQQF